ncbi:hypothetical protein Bbelb_427080 [Branchiostoma belcheri]|nr:hypothetical protein Bbelb_427080 [Branchiostoma belcheri]
MIRWNRRCQRNVILPGKPAERKGVSASAVTYRLPLTVPPGSHSAPQTHLFLSDDYIDGFHARYDIHRSRHPRRTRTCSNEENKGRESKYGALCLRKSTPDSFQTGE